MFLFCSYYCFEILRVYVRVCREYAAAVAVAEVVVSSGVPNKEYTREKNRCSHSTTQCTTAGNEIAPQCHELDTVCNQFTTLVAVVVVPPLIDVVYNNWELVCNFGWIRCARNVLGHLGPRFVVGMGGWVNLEGNRPSGRLAPRKPALFQARVTPGGPLVFLTCGLSNITDKLRAVLP